MTEETDAVPEQVGRTPQRVVDTFEAKLGNKPGRVNLVCESEDEAVLVVHELKKRGWRAEFDTGINLLTGEGIFAAVVEGKEGEKKKRRR